MLTQARRRWASCPTTRWPTLRGGRTLARSRTPPAARCPPRPRPLWSLPCLREQYLVTCLLGADLHTAKQGRAQQRDVYERLHVRAARPPNLRRDKPAAGQQQRPARCVTSLQSAFLSICKLQLLQWAVHAASVRQALNRGCAHVVTSDGKPLAHDPQPNHQNFTFAGTPSVQLQWSLQGNNQLPSVSVTSGAQTSAPRLLMLPGPSRPCSIACNSHCVTPACGRDG